MSSVYEENTNTTYDIIYYQFSSDLKNWLEEGNGYNSTYDMFQPKAGCLLPFSGI